jgi:hypothetical protein
MPTGTARVAVQQLTGGRRLSESLGHRDQFARVGRAEGGGSCRLIRHEAAHDGLGEPARRGLKGAHLG